MGTHSRDIVCDPKKHILTIYIGFYIIEISNINEKSEDDNNSKEELISIQLKDYLW